jgi:cation-transporting ATPase E
LFIVKNIFSLGLAILTFFTNWPYPMVPFHLSVISALTIGVPSFFLAMEPNYERVSGSFIRTVLRKALPGGLTNIFVVLGAQAYMAAFDLPLNQISTVCASILAIVGLLVLFQTCKPFDFFRKLIWAAMAVALVACFTFLGNFFELRASDLSVQLVMLTLLIMTPTVFFAMQRVFDWIDKLMLWIRGLIRKKKQA